MQSSETATLQNSTHAVRLLNLGCITQSLQMAHWDAERSAVLGYKNVEAYRNNLHFMGAVIGRVAGRIEGAAFSLEDQVYRLDANEDFNTLHGGAAGLSARFWDMDIDGTKAVQFRLTSHDGDQGFPANVDFVVTVTLDGDTLIYDMQAGTDAPTPINMTQHNYYNLTGAGTVAGHHLILPAKEMLETDKNSIPTRAIQIENGPKNFYQGCKITETKHASLDAYHCFGTTGKVLIKIKKDTASLTIETDQIGAQLYTAGKMNESSEPFGTQNHTPFSSICLEPQGYPNAINRPEFPSIIVTPDTPYRNTLKLTLADHGAT